MSTSTPRWPLGGGKRIVHALAGVLAFDAWQFLSFGVVIGVLHFPPSQIFAGHPLIIGTTTFSGVFSMVVIVWLGLVRLGRLTWRDLGWHTERLGQALLLGLLGLGLLTANLLGLLALQGFLGQMKILETIAAYTLAQRLLFLVLGLSASAIEESLFRGYLQPALVARTGLMGGILLQAIVFAAYHVFFLGPNLARLAGKIPSGVILGALRGRQGSLLAPVLAHCLFWQVFGGI